MAPQPRRGQGRVHHALDHGGLRLPEDHSNAELKALKLRYRVAVVQQEADIEAPTQVHDVRLTMRDVILVKRKRETA